VNGAAELEPRDTGLCGGLNLQISRPGGLGVHTGLEV
jgi:hypothetical protein